MKTSIFFTRLFIYCVSLKRQQKAWNKYIQGIYGQCVNNAVICECTATCWCANFSARSDIYKIQEGTGDRVGMLMQSVSNFLTSCIIGFSKGWKLTLVILAVSPVLCLSAALYSKVNILRAHPPPPPDPPCRPICTYNHQHHASPLAVDDNFHRQRAECVRQSWSHCRGGSVRHQNRLCLQWSEQRDQKVPHELIIKNVLF